MYIYKYIFKYSVFVLSMNIDSYVITNLDHWSQWNLWTRGLSKVPSSIKYHCIYPPPHHHSLCDDLQSQSDERFKECQVNLGLIFYFIFNTLKFIWLDHYQNWKIVFNILVHWKWFLHYRCFNILETSALPILCLEYIWMADRHSSYNFLEFALQ